jgi:hypothetical protein
MELRRTSYLCLLSLGLGMTSLKELDLSRCLKVTDAGIRHVISISTLEKLCISETGLTVKGIPLLSSLKNLSVLDLGGLPVTDQSLSSLQVLRFVLFVKSFLLNYIVNNCLSHVFSSFWTLTAPLMPSPFPLYHPKRWGLVV